MPQMSWLQHLNIDGKCKCEKALMDSQKLVIHRCKSWKWD